MLKGQCNRVVVIQKGTVRTVHTVDVNDSSVIFACILFCSPLVFSVPSSPNLLFPISVFSFCFTATFISHCLYTCSSILYLCLYSLPPFSISFIFPENCVFCVTVIQQYLLPWPPLSLLFLSFFGLYTLPHFSPTSLPFLSCICLSVESQYYPSKRDRDLVILH